MRSIHRLTWNVSRLTTLFRFVALVAGLTIPLISGQAQPTTAQTSRRASAFPHRRHERLFPTCDGCHAGIATGEASRSFPTEAQCQACHNGTDAAVVTWRRTSPPAGLLRFSHPAHLSYADSAARACASCHSPGKAARMDVSHPVPETCLGCHAHAATAHLAEDNRCATCHVPVTAARAITVERIASFPRPPSHDARDFASAHGPNARRASATCAMCHARESCARCHVNASAIPQIAALARDDRFVTLLASRPRTVTYPTPADHAGPSFAYAHGPLARGAALRCGACHTRASCATCHLDAATNSDVRAMPNAERGGATGVQLEHLPVRTRFNPPLSPVAALTLAAPLLQQGNGQAAPPARLVRVHDIGFRTAHGAQAAAGSLTCAGCHAQRFCTDCHAGEGRRRFHPENFEARHAADANGRENECSSCHNAEVFCRSCHRQSGLGARGRLDAAYHTAQPLWLLQHGRAARQGLANCTTCHAQRDCLTCHSTLGWSVNPHGASFDAARMAKVAGPTCLRCHLQIPSK